jgi:hypothetical protein
VASKLYTIGAAYAAALTASVAASGKTMVAFVSEHKTKNELVFVLKKEGEVGPADTIAVVFPTKLAIDAALAKANKQDNAAAVKVLGAKNVKKEQAPKKAAAKKEKGKRPQKAAAKKK